jgi:hypothetical protein
MTTAARKGDEAVEPYGPPGERRPLGGYLAVLAAYGAGVAAAAAAARLTGRSMPDRIGLQDLATMTVATHRISRLVSKDAVLSPVRAPLTRFEGPAGAAEVNESVRYRGGVPHAVGELLTCPFCTAVWSATALTAGMVLAPRLTRLVSAAATAVAGADFLHLAYDLVKRELEGDRQKGH